MRGFKATRSEWDAEREPRAGYTVGAVYGPDVRPRQPKCSAVSWGDGDAASGFTLNFPDGTTREEARAAVMQELPEGAVVAMTREDPNGWTDGIGGTDVLAEGYWPKAAYRLNDDGQTVRWAAFGTFTEGELPPP